MTEQMTTAQLTKTAVDLIRTLADPFVGQPNSSDHRDLMMRAVATKLQEYKDKGLLESFRIEGTKVHYVRRTNMTQLTMANLNNAFEGAREQGAKYLAVLVQMPDTPEPELIINPAANFDIKQAYYNRAYKENLELLTYDAIKIVGFVHADTITEIENLLDGVKESGQIVRELEERDTTGALSAEEVEAQN